MNTSPTLPELQMEYCPASPKGQYMSLQEVIQNNLPLAVRAVEVLEGLRL